MTKETFQRLETYMLSCAADSAHDREHIYRVMNTALQIAGTEPEADMDVLIAACLLHDVGRPEQFADPSVCHAQAGGEKAYNFLLEQGFGDEFAQQVRHCIQTHRFRSGALPQSLEAKILFDADKLDVTGAIGIARTLLYQGKTGSPLYSLRPDGSICGGTDDREDTFFREYRFKLEKLYGKFFTPCGAAMGEARRQAAESFFQSLYAEVADSHSAGSVALERCLE